MNLFLLNPINHCHFFPSLPFFSLFLPSCSVVLSFFSLSFCFPLSILYDFPLLCPSSSLLFYSVLSWSLFSLSLCVFLLLVSLSLSFFLLLFPLLLYCSFSSPSFLSFHLLSSLYSFILSPSLSLPISFLFCLSLLLPPLLAPSLLFPSILVSLFLYLFLSLCCPSYLLPPDYLLSVPTHLIQFYFSLLQSSNFITFLFFSFLPLYQLQVALSFYFPAIFSVLLYSLVSSFCVSSSTSSLISSVCILPLCLHSYFSS